MNRFAYLTAGVALAFTAGCDGGNQTMTRPDMARPVFDLAVTLDMTMLAETGAACAMNTECAPSTRGTMTRPVCTRSSNILGMTVMWTGGYCQSPCLASNVDQSTGLANDCPSANATCFLMTQSGGLCATACQGVGDCRAEYVCAYVTSTNAAACIPKASSTCDPPMNPSPSGRNCGANQKCVAYSPDNSYGGCADLCDPIDQNCTDMSEGCIVDRDDPMGLGTCIGVSGRPEGSPCTFLNSCEKGAQCNGGTCRQYCRTAPTMSTDMGMSTTDGGTRTLKACPMGQTCRRISMAPWDTDVLGICSP